MKISIIVATAITLMLSGLTVRRVNPTEPVLNVITFLRQSEDSAWYELRWSPPKKGANLVGRYSMSIVRNPSWNYNIDPSISPDTFAIFSDTIPQDAQVCVNAHRAIGNQIKQSCLEFITPGQVIMGPPDSLILTPIDTLVNDTIDFGDISIDSTTQVRSTLYWFTDNTKPIIYARACYDYNDTTALMHTKVFSNDSVSFLQPIETPYEPIITVCT